MNTIQLEYFLTTAGYGSFSRTANAFYTTQPTVSRQIQLLEEELGYELFDRNSRPLKLTAAGKVFQENLGPVLDTLENIKRKGKLAAQGTYGTVNVTFPAGLGIEEVYAELLMDIRHSIPGLHVHYQKMDTRGLKEALLSQRTDLAVVLDTSAIEDDELEIIDLDQLKSYIVMSPEHPLACQGELEEDDLIDEEIYLINPMEGYSYRRGMLAGFHMKKENMLEVENIETALMNVRFSGGVTIANNYMNVIEDPEKYRCFPVRDDSRNPYVSVVYCKNNTNPAVAIFRDLIRDYRR